MNKTELIKAVKEDLGFETNVETEEVLNGIFSIIVENAIKDGECVLPKIGKLKVVETAPTKERKGVIQGIEYTTPAKPAGKKFKLQVLKEGKLALV